MDGNESEAVVSSGHVWQYPVALVLYVAAVLPMLAARMVYTQVMQAFEEMGVSLPGVTIMAFRFFEHIPIVIALLIVLGLLKYAVLRSVAPRFIFDLSLFGIALWWTAVFALGLALPMLEVMVHL